MVVDYFAQGYNLVFKPHPDDLMYYDVLFPESNVIKTKFPSELIPFVFNERPEAVMTITSTAINNLIDFFEKHIRFSMEFEKNFNMVHRYYCAIKKISELKGDCKIYQINSDRLLLENITKYTDIKTNHDIISVDDLSQISNKSIIIIDDYNINSSVSFEDINCFLEAIDEQSIVIFINSNKEYAFYNYPNKDVFGKLVAVEIKYKNLQKEDEEVLEKIFIYSKRSEIRNMINQIEFKKILENANEELSVDTMSEDKLKIKILEGILEATEKRLEHYIKLESELREKVNSF